MKQSEKINKEIEATSKLQAEASELLLALQAKLTAMQADIGDKLLTNKNTSTKELDELKEEVDRQSLTSQAYARRITLLKEDLEKALELEKQEAIRSLEDKAIEIHRDAIKHIYALYQTADKLIALDREYSKLAGGFSRGKGLYMGIPFVDVFNKTDTWLNQASQGTSDIQAILQEVGVPTYLEREKARSKGKKSK